MIRLLTTLFAAMLLSGCFGQPANSRDVTRAPSTGADALICTQGEPATLVKVVDGDTIDVKLANGEQERIRLIGIDTPERGETCFTEATDRLKALLADGQVTLMKDKSERDRYGRLVRYVCSAGGIFTEGRLVREGYAVPYRYYPDVYYANYLQELGAEATADATGCLYENAMRNSSASGTACCLICRNGKACGDSCIPHDVTCRLKTGCACDG